MEDKHAIQIPDAKAIYEELKKHFSGHKHRCAGDDAPEVEANA
jgi:hypothetical protein